MASCYSGNHEWELRRVPCTNCKYNFSFPGFISCSECRGIGTITITKHNGTTDTMMCHKCSGTRKVKCGSCQSSLWENRFYCKKCDQDKKENETNEFISSIIIKIKNCLCGNK